jgi:hypothetical protein
MALAYRDSRPAWTSSAPPFLRTKDRDPCVYLEAEFDEDRIEARGAGPAAGWRDVKSVSFGFFQAAFQKEYSEEKGAFVTYTRTAATQ